MQSFFPALNASLNGLAGVFLVLGWFAIKKGDRSLHKRYMVSALAASSLFLVSYLSYHLMIQGVTHYQKQGLSRIIYFFILLTHTPLAALIVPFCIAATIYAVKGDLKRHTRITKWLLPVWLYVSVTGVLIYLMLYVL